MNVSFNDFPFLAKAQTLFNNAKDKATKSYFWEQATKLYQKDQKEINLKVAAFVRSSLAIGTVSYIPVTGIMATTYAAYKPAQVSDLIKTIDKTMNTAFTAFNSLTMEQKIGAVSLGVISSLGALHYYPDVTLSFLMSGICFFGSKSSCEILLSYLQKERRNELSMEIEAKSKSS